MMSITMHFTTPLSVFLILLFVSNCSVRGQNTAGANPTSLSVTTTTNSETSESTVLSCLGGHVNPPECTKCLANYENQNKTCLKIKNDGIPSRGSSRRIFLIILACLLTIFLFVAMLMVYGRFNRQRQQRLSTNPENNVNSNTNVNNRFNNILRSIGLTNLNKRGRFNFFSISNNNSTLGQYHQPDTSRAHLNENPDEALLFDDPYADGGLLNSAANPYKSLTLAVT